MILKIFEQRSILAYQAAQQAALAIRDAIRRKNGARIIAASAASQIEFLNELVTLPDIDWRKVELFHLDEYIGLPMDHPASFCRFLQERLISRTGITNYHLLNGQADPGKMIREVSEAITASPIDVAFVGIGENGHLAFNDPPADFETDAPFITVTLDEPCRRQQVGEGWFSNLDAVPTRAISMSVRQVLKAKEILAIVPGIKKAEAIKACFEGPIRPDAPSSILRTHRNATIYLDKESACLLQPATVSELASA